MSAKILFVDDDNSLLRALRRSLYDVFELHIASSGQEALELIQRDGPYHCIVTDLKMPHMDGLELARRISQVATSTPCIILSGSQDIDSLARAETSPDAVQLLKKPVTIAELVEAINRAIRGATENWLETTELTHE